MNKTILAEDHYGNPIQVLGIEDVQTVTVNASSVQSTAISDKTVVRLVSTTACHIVMGPNPTANTSCTLLPANSPEYFKVEDEDKIAVIRNTEDGTLFVSVMQ